MDNFLLQDTTGTTSPVNHHAQSQKPQGQGSGFMNSFLAFLEGKMDTFPPPADRGGRKQSWSVPAPFTQLLQGDPQDDDGGLTSEDDVCSPKKNQPSPNQEPEEKVQKEKVIKPKGRPCKSGGLTEKKKAEQEEQPKDRKEKEKNEAKAKQQAENVPRRESIKRAAKGKANLAGISKDEEPSEVQNSYSVSANNDEEDLILPFKKNRRGRPVGSKSKKGLKNPITVAAQGVEIDEGNGFISDQPHKKISQKSKQNIPPISEGNIAASLQNSILHINDDNPFKPGEFVVIKSELKQEWPAIWRVDGKTLLQKYEPFEHNGVTLYRNISWYTSWTPESKKQYMPVPIKYRSLGQLGTIVEFLKNEVSIIDHEYQENCMKQFESYQNNFEVYIQTLISHALDSNFLMQISQEKNDYFLSNIQTIDEITDSKKQKLLALLRWSPAVQAAVCTWPCFSIREVGISDAQSKNCVACDRIGVTVRVLMYGQPYNATTLEGCQPDPNAINEKDFLMCRICTTRVELLSKVTHQKYLMYIECAKRVSEKYSTDPTRDTTCILNELLADEGWLNQLFVEVQTSWAEIDSIEHSFNSKNSVQSQ